MDTTNAQAKLQDLGLATRAWTNVVVVEEALRRGIEVFRKGESTQIYFRNAAGRVHRWRGGSTSLNTILSRRVARHKQVANALLRAQGVAATENAAFAAGEVERAWEWAKKFKGIVLKPTDSTHGKNVFVNVQGRREFKQVYRHIAAEHKGGVLVEEFSDGVEHRCLLVKDKLVAVTRRRPASVLGDGVKTVAELVEEKNRDRGVIHKPLEIGPAGEQELARQRHKPTSIPPKGVRIYLRRTTNIHTGGDAIDATDDLSDRTVELIEAASRAIPGANVIGLDVLIDECAGDEGVRFIEMNLAPMISMHHYPWEGQARNVAAAVMDAMYPETAAERLNDTG